MVYKVSSCMVYLGIFTPFGPTYYSKFVTNNIKMSSSSTDEMTGEQREILEQFQSITGMSTDLSKEILVEKNWNLQQAVEEALELPPAQPSSHNHRESSNPPSSSDDHRESSNPPSSSSSGRNDAAAHDSSPANHFGTTTPSTTTQSFGNFASCWLRFITFPLIWSFKFFWTIISLTCKSVTT